MKNSGNFNFTVVPQDFLNQIQMDLQEMKKILSEKAESEVNALSQLKFLIFWGSAVKHGKPIGINE